MTRVLMTADTVGGVWTYALDLAHALGEQRVEVTLFAMGGPAPPSGWAEAAEIPTLTLIETDHRLEWMEEPWADVDEAGRRLLELEREIRPDVVHLNGYAHAALPFAAPKLVVGHSCVLSWWQAVHGVPAPAEWEVYRQRVRRGLAAADLVLAPTWAMLDALERLYGPFAASGVVYNGRPGELFTAAAKEELVFAAGRLWDPAKNLAALEAVADRLSWPIAVAGSEVPPGEEAAAGEPGGAGVRRLGRLAPEEVAGWLARASIYAFPARYEPFGLSVLEAALAGCALVLGDLPSLRELWDDAACFVDPDDADRLAAAVQDLIDRPEARHELASRAHRRARTLQPVRMAEGYLDAYRSLTHGLTAVRAAV